MTLRVTGGGPTFQAQFALEKCGLDPPKSQLGPQSLLLSPTPCHCPSEVGGILAELGAGRLGVSRRSLPAMTLPASVLI